jgi:hypothetical protein
MPEHAALIAVLIIERPLCVNCISDKSGLSADEVEAYLGRVRRSVSVEHGAQRRSRATLDRSSRLILLVASAALRSPAAESFA